MFQNDAQKYLKKILDLDPSFYFKLAEKNCLCEYFYHQSIAFPDPVIPSFDPTRLQRNLGWVFKQRVES